jgi:hypothetical protein
MPGSAQDVCVADKTKVIYWGTCSSTGVNGVNVRVYIP